MMYVVDCCVNAAGSLENKVAQIMPMVIVEVVVVVNVLLKVRMVVVSALKTVHIVYLPV